MLPLLMVLGGVITWLIMSRVEDLKATEKRLQEQQRKIYAQIVDSYLQIFADPKDQGQAQALNGSPTTL